MLDYLWDPATGRPTYIEANPRLGETLNATLSGVNLARLLVDVALGRPVAPVPAGRPGVRTHSVVMTLLARAEDGATRRQLLAELGQACSRRGLYGGSQDELTRPVEDPLSLGPAAFLCLRLLLNPGAADFLVRGAVDNYALTEAAARAIHRLEHRTPNAEHRTPNEPDPLPVGRSAFGVRRSAFGVPGGRS